MTGVPAGLFDHVHEDPSQGHWLGRYGPAFRGLGEICSFRDDPVAHRDSHLIAADHRLRLIVIGQIVAGNPHVRTCERILKPGDLHSGEVLDQPEQARA